MGSEGSSMVGWDRELDVVEWVQGLGDAWEPVMALASALGEPVWYVPVVAVVYWCISHQVGLRFGLFVFVSGTLNDILKQLFGSPRPFWLSRDIETFGHSSTAFGMPSGHAQVGSVAWAYLIGSIGRRWIPLGLAVGALLGLSRIYLGQHFASQTVVGWVVGALLLVAMLRYEAPVLAWFTTRPVLHQVLTVIAVTGALLVAGGLAIAIRSGWEAPAEWLANTEGRLDDDEALEPTERAAITTSVGAFAGAALGAVLANATGALTSAGSPIKRALRLPVGVVTLLTCVAAVGAVLSLPGLNSESRAMEMARDFVFTTTVFGAITGLAPLMFKRLKLSGHPDDGRCAPDTTTT